MINKKKSYLALNIILIFFMIELLILPIKVQAASNISINLKAPIHEGVIEDKELNIDGEIESISKIKLAYVYIDNNNVGQAKLNELEFKENTYKTKLEYNKDISSLKDGVYNLKILAIDEQDNKEEKEISIKIKRNQEEVSDNRVNIYEEQLVENDKNIVQRNLEYDNVKISSTEKALTTVYNKATISNLEVSLNGTVVTNGKLEQGKTYTIKGNGNSANGVLYQFWIKDPYTQVWQMIRDYGTGNSMNWTPTRTGKYLVGIHVKDKNSKERLDDHKYVEYNVEQNSSKATISNLEVSLNGTVVTNGKLEQGKTYTIKGNGNSANGVLYQFWIKDPYTQVWQMIRDYGTGNSMNWTPTRTGKYLVGIHVKDKNSKERLDDHKYVEYNVEQNSSKATISNLEVSLNGTVVTNGKLEQGKTYTIKGNGNSANGVLYQFWIKDPYTQVWQMIRDYGTGNSMNWTPTRTGKYLVGIHVKDKNSKERLDDHKYVEYNVEQNSSKATISNLEVSLNGTIVTNGKLEQGKTYTIKGNGNSSNGVLYQFWIKDPYTQVWQMIRDYGTGNSMNWTPTRTGKYLVGIHVKDKNSKERLDDHKYVEYNVEQSSSKATISNLEVSLNGTVVANGKLEQGKTYTIKGNGNSANGVLYQFWIKDPYTQVWQMIRDYGTGNSMNWTPTRTGKYLVGIHVKDKNSKERLDDHKYVEYNVEQNSSKATISNLEVSLNGVLVTNGKLEQGKTYTIKGNGNSANGVLYQFWIKDPYTQVWQMIRDYGTGNSMNWTPTRTGKYLVGIHVKDKNSKERLDDHKYLEYNVEQSSSKATISNLEVSLNGVLVTNGNLEQGKTYAIKGNGNSANGVLYQFWIKDPYTQVWQMIRDYGTGNSVNWAPTRTGQYLVGIHVKDKYSKEKLDDHKYVEYNVAASNKRTIVIDAGHGGYDSGAVGPTGIKEKDVTLKVALKVGKILENNGIRVIYTRTSDNVSWPSNESQDLAARVAIANNNNTDLFVSIHANSFNGSAHGTETYYYDGSAKGKEAATAVQKELINSIGLYDRGVKTAGYYVLRNTISPSILVELGFIDNRNEEVLLNSDWFQQKCAEAIAKGIIGTSFI